MVSKLPFKFSYCSGQRFYTNYVISVLSFYNQLYIMDSEVRLVYDGGGEDYAKGFKGINAKHCVIKCYIFVNLNKGFEQSILN